MNKERSPIHNLLSLFKCAIDKEKDIYQTEESLVLSFIYLCLLVLGHPSLNWAPPPSLVRMLQHLSTMSLHCLRGRNPYLEDKESSICLSLKNFTYSTPIYLLQRTKRKPYTPTELKKGALYPLEEELWLPSAIVTRKAKKESYYLLPRVLCVLIPLLIHTGLSLPSRNESSLPVVYTYLSQASFWTSS